MFKVKKPKDFHELLEKGRKEGFLVGDEEKGSFSYSLKLGTIKGTYDVIDDDIEITVTKKLFGITENTIKSKIEDFFKTPVV